MTLERGYLKNNYIPPSTEASHILSPAIKIPGPYFWYCECIDAWVNSSSRYVLTYLCRCCSALLFILFLFITLTHSYLPWLERRDTVNVLIHYVWINILALLLLQGFFCTIIKEKSSFSLLYWSRNLST